MKRLMPVFAVVSLATFATASQAQSPGVYAELGYSALELQSSVNGRDVSSSPANVRGILGYELGRNLALETMLSVGLDDAPYKVLGVDTGRRAEVSNMIGVFVKPTVTVGDGLDLFGRFGGARTQLSIDGRSDSATSIAYGLGASYRINSQLSLNADYMTYHDKDATTVQGVTFGLGYRF